MDPTNALQAAEAGFLDATTGLILVVTHVISLVAGKYMDVIIDRIKGRKPSNGRTLETAVDIASMKQDLLDHEDVCRERNQDVNARFDKIDDRCLRIERDISTINVNVATMNGRIDLILKLLEKKT